MTEYEKFVESFRLAKTAIEKNIFENRKNVKTPTRRTAYDELTNEGHWEGEWLAEQFMLIAIKQSRLSRRLRQFIVRVGFEAKAQYDLKWGKDEQKEAPVSAS